MRERQQRRERWSARVRRAAAGIAALAVLALAGGAAAQTFIAFHSPQNDGQALGPKPSPPPLAINVGGTAVLNLYLENFDPTGASSSGTGGSGQPLACVSGAGDEVCGWLLELLAEGMRIDGFSDAQGGEGNIVSMLTATGESLKVAGGSPDGQLGPVAVGAVQVTVLSPNASLELAGGSFIDAAGRLRQPAIQVLAVSIDTCGNGGIEPPEECDDGNATAGDGCFPSCRGEDGFTLSGTAQGGTIELRLSERATPLVVTTIAGESADLIAARLAMLLDDDPELSAAARSAAAVPGPGVVTDATLNAASSSDPGLQLVLLPEPSVAGMLLAGAALLRALAARRRRS